MEIHYQSKFVASYTVNPATGCWKWHGTLGRTGRPIFYDQHQATYPARRVAWFLQEGEEPPWPLASGCGDELCVAPRHSIPDHIYEPYQFWAALDWSNPDGCWEWQGGCGGPSSNYGYIKLNGKIWRSHRLAWTLAHGEIPRGLLIRHLCNNSKCCRPDHLALGTHKMNAKDRDEANHTVRGERWNQVHKPFWWRLGERKAEFIRDANMMSLDDLAVKYNTTAGTAYTALRHFGMRKRRHTERYRRGVTLTWEKVREIRQRLREPDAHQGRIAADYGVGQAMISAIKHNRTWKEADDPMVKRVA